MTNIKCLYNWEFHHKDIRIYHLFLSSCFLLAKDFDLSKSLHVGFAPKGDKSPQIYECESQIQYDTSIETEQLSTTKMTIERRF